MYNRLHGNSLVEFHKRIRDYFMLGMSSVEVAHVEKKEHSTILYHWKKIGLNVQNQHKKPNEYKIILEKRRAEVIKEKWKKKEEIFIKSDCDHKGSYCDCVHMGRGYESLLREDKRKKYKRFFKKISPVQDL